MKLEAVYGWLTFKRKTLKSAQLTRLRKQFIHRLQFYLCPQSHFILRPCASKFYETVEIHIKAMKGITRQHSLRKKTKET